jgi:hypothetical protein
VLDQRRLVARLAAQRGRPAQRALAVEQVRRRLELGDQALQDQRVGR